MTMVTKRIGMGLVKEPEMDLSKGCNPHCIYFNEKRFQCFYDGHSVTSWCDKCPRAKNYKQEGVVIQHG